MDNVFKYPIKWNRLKTRKANSIEKEQGYTFMWEGEIPELFEEVLVSDGRSIWTDIWTEFDEGVGFEEIETDCWWMPYPPLPEKEK